MIDYSGPGKAIGPAPIPATNTLTPLTQDTFNNDPTNPVTGGTDPIRVDG